MILLVPISPEVPKFHKPRIWPGLVFVLVLAIAYLEAHPILKRDSGHIDDLQNLGISRQKDGKISPQVHEFLKKRPLLKISPAKGDWDVRRLLLANFIHGSTFHLMLNLIGAFAAARILTTFIPFLCTVSIFLIGGSVGLFASLFGTQQVSDYIPHVGASGGIFAMLGAFYIYNFRYRTRYFFWFPSQRGFVSLRTATFFFFDAILLEIVLSAAQLAPGRVDSVDHVAHVVGFICGLFIAVFLRFFQRWPSFLQTRGEFMYWAKYLHPRNLESVYHPIDAWLELLAINAYNDRIKVKLFRRIARKQGEVSDTQLTASLFHLTPTFIRLQTKIVSACLKECMRYSRNIPLLWYKNLPYDSLIRIAKEMARLPEELPLLVEFVTQYRQVHSFGGDIDRKLELLMRKLSAISPEAPAGVAGSPGSEALDSRPPKETRGSLSGKARR